MTIFDIALAHQRERESAPHTAVISARELALAAMIGRMHDHGAPLQLLTPPPPAAEQVDLDQIGDSYAIVLDPDADDVIFID